MTPVSFAEAQRQHPDLVDKVLEKLARSVRNLDPAKISWSLVACHDEPDELLDEAAIADVMLTGRMPCRIGVSGRIAGHFACFCHERMVEREKVGH